MRDRLCASAVKAIAVEVGLPPETIDVAIAGAFTATQQGEETRYRISPVTGYRICHVKVRTTSVVPATGDRASLFSISATRTGVGIYTWTPRRGIGSGRSWYDGYVFVTHVRADLADQYAKSGNCSVPENSPPVAYQCRGASGVNNGLASRGSKDL